VPSPGHGLDRVLAGGFDPQDLIEFRQFDERLDAVRHGAQCHRSQQPELIGQTNEKPKRDAAESARTGQIEDEVEKSGPDQFLNLRMQFGHGIGIDLAGERYDHDAVVVVDLETTRECGEAIHHTFPRDDASFLCCPA